MFKSETTTFPLGFQISKNIGHPTSGSGGKKTVPQTIPQKWTHGQTDRQTDRQTNRLIESIGQKGRCFENSSFDIGIFCIFLNS